MTELWTTGTTLSPSAARTTSLGSCNNDGMLLLMMRRRWRTDGWRIEGSYVLDMSNRRRAVVVVVVVSVASIDCKSLVPFLKIGKRLGQEVLENSKSFHKKTLDVEYRHNGARII